MKHTPGPWAAYHDHGWLVVESANGDLYVKVEKGSAANKHIADAHLIAAAPDLLEALVDLLHQAKLSEHEGGWDFDPARAAIAKATGETK